MCIRDRTNIAGQTNVKYGLCWSTENTPTINDQDVYKRQPQVHPHNKKGIGERLAYMSLNKTYGYQGIESEYPSYKSMKINGETIEISFSHAEKGLSPWMNISGFEIAGSDKVFYPAEASLKQKDHTGLLYTSRCV